MIKEKQLEDLSLKRTLELLGTNQAKDFVMGEDEILPCVLFCVCFSLICDDRVNLHGSR